MKLTVTNNPKQDDDDVVAEGVRRYNRQFVANTPEPLSVYIHDADGRIIAGLTGKTSGNWLQISFLWVSDEHRGYSLGSKVLLAAESEAVKRGCTASTLDTFSFQAPDFYQKKGYKQFGILNGVAGSHKKYYLQKSLEEVGGD